MLCAEKNLCDDNIDNECYVFRKTGDSTERKVHKHMTCDGVSRYNEGHERNAEWCRHMTTREKCIRWVSRFQFIFSVGERKIVNFLKLFKLFLKLLLVFNK